MAERLQLDSGVLLDARGAAWFPEEGILAAADLNFGFAAGSRQRGPLGSSAGPDELAFRLADLLADYRPIKTVVLGDLVQGGSESPVIENAVKTLVATVACYGTMVVVVPNPEARMESLKRRWSLALEAVPAFEVGRLIFGSGAGAEPTPGGTGTAPPAGDRLRVIGNECPTVAVGHPGAPGRKCPCFVVTPTRLLLPAFAPHAVGNDIRAEKLASHLTSEAAAVRIVAIVGQRLLSVPWLPAGS
jgi:metallophosphoesterase superfamily enzyme